MDALAKGERCLRQATLSSLEGAQTKGLACACLHLVVLFVDVRLSNGHHRWLGSQILSTGAKNIGIAGRRCALLNLISSLALSLLLLCFELHRDRGGRDLVLTSLAQDTSGLELQATLQSAREGSREGGLRAGERPLVIRKFN